jgi:TonB-dependent receptor
MKVFKRGLIIILALLSFTEIEAQNIRGKVVDAQTGEALVGAAITIEGRKEATVTDINGDFGFKGLDKSGRYNLTISYISYKSKKIDGVQSGDDSNADSIRVKLIPDEHLLKEVSVTGLKRGNTETVMIQSAKNSPVIVSNISAQEITKTQDSNAGEVIRRVPGVSLIDDKFVMVRGLSQRYNNVWINGGAVPSSESDSRAFSFDIIPSSQIDNLTIVKTANPEYPADYCGGFIIINTKEIPSDNSFTLMVGGNENDATDFKSYKYSHGSGTDFLGFDNGLRSLKGGIGAKLKSIDTDGTDLLNNGFNNDWMVKSRKPIGDFKLGANWNHHWMLGEDKLGMIASMNYTNEYRSYTNMKNNLFGVYDASNDRSVYLRHSVDNQYNNNVRFGAMLNLTLLSPSGNNKYELKNIFNQLATNRFTYREGISAQSDNEQSSEYYYRSRTTYNGQLTGKHTLGSDALDWSIGYAYANRHLPDRRRYLIDDVLETGVMALTTGNDVSREWTQLDEHIMSANINDNHTFNFGNFSPSLKFGAYSEYRTRSYKTREFIYNWNAYSNNLPSDFRHQDIPTLLSDEQNFGADKLYMLEQVRYRNNYDGHNTLGAGYIAASLPFGKFGIYAGVRFEHNRMELISNTRDNEVSKMSTYYTNNDLFPSLNALYKFDERNQLRLSYGKSVNRPEFREVSSSVYYDFDLASSVQGNTELKSCYINNVDVRYEYYPSRGEIISLAAFYEHFNNPIEWTYTVAGGTDLIYSYKNAASANNVGLELDIRKDLSFIGLNGFSWSFNGSLINSKVHFPSNAKEKNRPMQGQSPYLINTGLFYKNDPLKLNLAVLYNRIGKRIIGVGRSEGTTGSDENARIPDSYEMPRDVIDLSASKKCGSHWEFKANVRDLLAQNVTYKQFADVTYGDGTKRKVQQITRQYKPGRNIGLSVIYTF